MSVMPSGWLNCCSMGCCDRASSRPFPARKEQYRELGGDYFDRQRPEATVKRLTHRLEQLGYDVIIQKPGEAVAA